MVVAIQVKEDEGRVTVVRAGEVEEVDLEMILQTAKLHLSLIRVGTIYMY